MALIEANIATTAAPALLSTRGLTKLFGGVAAVNNVDFTLGDGELRCLIGPNGAGKSTFLKMLSGQIQPSRGTILFEDRSIVGRERHDIARAGMGIKTQVPSVFNALTVTENLRIAAMRNRHKRPAREVIDEIVAKLGFAGIARRPVGELAHGQRQWVELGLLLATAPKLMLLDEPVAGMSDEETDRTADLIGELSKHAALIVIDHDIRFIRMIGARVTVFNRGEVLVDGPAEEVFENQMVRDVYLGRQAARDA